MSLLQTFSGAGVGGAITAAYRAGFQTWEKLRANIVTLNAQEGRVRNPALTTPSGLANGDVWVEASGTTPSRVIELKLRDGGATVTIFTMTY